MKALGTKVIIRQVAKEEKKGALFLPAAVADNRGTVVSVGPKVEDVTEQDQVLFDPKKSSRFEHAGEQFIITDESDLVAVL